MFSHSLGASSVPCSCPPVASLDLCTKSLMLLGATQPTSTHCCGLLSPRSVRVCSLSSLQMLRLLPGTFPSLLFVTNYTFFILGGSQSKPLFLKAGCSGASFQCESLSFPLSIACTCLSFLQSAPVCICTLSNGSVG